MKKLLGMILKAVIVLVVGVLVLVAAVNLTSERALDQGLAAIPGAFEAGMLEFQAGNFDDAAALFERVPQDHPQYAMAMRFLGWEIFTKVRGESKRGVAYVNRAIWAEPLSGNAWQDLARTYLHRMSDWFE
jgi:hypothetical protein